MSEISEIEIKSMTKEQNYMRGYEDGKSDVLDEIRAELKDYITHSPYIKSFMDCCRLRDDVMRIIDKYKVESEENNGRKDNDI